MTIKPEEVNKMQRDIRIFFNKKTKKKRTENQAVTRTIN